MTTARETVAGVTVSEEIVLEKYEGDPLPGDTPIEVVRIRDGKVVSRELHPPAEDPTLAVIAGTEG